MVNHYWSPLFLNIQMPTEWMKYSTAISAKYPITALLYTFVHLYNIPVLGLFLFLSIRMSFATFLSCLLSNFHPLSCSLPSISEIKTIHCHMWHCSILNTELCALRSIKKYHRLDEEIEISILKETNCIIGCKMEWNVL